MKIGIDLGTTYSLTAYLDPTGAPSAIPDAHDSEIIFTPSVVCLSSGSAFVGRQAEILELQGLRGDQKTNKFFRFFKRRLGSMEAIANDDVGGVWYPETLSALVLKKLRHDAEAHLAEDVSGVVITVPAHFGDAPRKAVLEAAHLANLPVLDLIDEPIAAALHYGFKHSFQHHTVLVYDLGGGTFDTTILSIEKDKMKVLAKSGLTDLGGKEFDQCIAQMILQKLEQDIKVPIDTKNYKFLRQLGKISEEIKIKLSWPGNHYIDHFIEIEKEIHKIQITRAAFEKSISNLIERTEETTLRCLQESGLQSKDIKTILLVGGSSMIPLIKKKLERLFDGSQVIFHEPAKAVAFGASIYAGMLTGKHSDSKMPTSLQGVSSYNVGVRVLRGARIEIDTIILKNKPLPQTAKRVYYTTRPNQEQVILEFVQFREKEEKDIAYLGHLRVGPLPPSPVSTPIEVTVEYKADGTIAISVSNPNRKGEKLSATFGQNISDETQRRLQQEQLVRSTPVNNIR